MIDEHGEPENILILRVKGERSIVSVFILYPSQGFGFIDFYASELDLGETVQITPDEEVKSAWYGKVEEFYDYLSEGQVARLPIELIDQGNQEWNGYGEYTYIEE